MRPIARDFLKVLVSFVITAFGIPSLSGILSAAAASFGYALFWSGIVSQKNHRFALAVVWFTGVQAVQLNWMVSMEYMGPAILGVYLLVIVALGLQFGFLTWFIRPPVTWIQILGLSGFWVLMEWARLFFLTGFPWNPIGLALAANSYSIQAASLFGIYGLCFWVIFVNLLALNLVLRDKKSTEPDFYKWLSSSPLAFCGLKKCRIWLVFALLPYCYGVAHQLILRWTLPQGKEMSVALVQTALRPEQRNRFRTNPSAHIHPLVQWDLILTHLEKLKKDRFDLIALSEGAIPNGPWKFLYPYGAVKAIWERHFGEGSEVDFPSIIAPFGEGKKVSNSFWIQALANRFHAEVIAGLDDREGDLFYNAAFHFSPQKNHIDRYQKQILIPIGEYIPFTEWKWLAEFVSKEFGIGDSFSPGTKVTIFQGQVPMGVFICLEETYSHLVREIRRNGAKLLVNLTNDVWFPETRLPWHHFDHGRLRAVENGVCLLRATNTGVTAAIDCFGDPVAIFPPSEKEAGVLDIKFAMRSYATLYTFLGDVPVLLLSGFFLCFFGIDQALQKKKLL
jgi:apolipoprotein N-acyltransferase